MNQMLPGLPKKIVPPMIPRVLREETDGEHHPTQEEIRERIKSRYEISIDRKAVKRIIDMFGRDVVFSDETDRHVTVSARERARDVAAREGLRTRCAILELKRLAEQVRAGAERTLAAYKALEEWRGGSNER